MCVCVCLLWPGCTGERDQNRQHVDTDTGRQAGWQAGWLAGSSMPCHSSIELPSLPTQEASPPASFSTSSSLSPLKWTLSALIWSSTTRPAILCTRRQLFWADGPWAPRPWLRPRWPRNSSPACCQHQQPLKQFLLHGITALLSDSVTMVALSRSLVLINLSCVPTF